MLRQAMTSDAFPPDGERIPTWREPAQARGRARVAALLNAARDLAAETGSLDFNMSEVAERAGAPIGSLYQFFPNRTALLARLFEREMAPIDNALRARLAAAASTRDVVEGIGDLLRKSLALVKARPFLFAIWSSPTMDPALQAADLKNSMENAELIAARVRELSDGAANPTDAWETALVVCHLWGSVVRLSALMADAQPGSGVLEQYVAMVEARFRAILG
ncbi:MAG: TetR/AcrR family transcriptional regulator [Parvularculaceae bacterium]